MAVSRAEVATGTAAKTSISKGLERDLPISTTSRNLVRRKPVVHDMRDLAESMLSI